MEANHPMHQHRTTIISRSILGAACLFLIAALAFAHGGLEHVMGTVINVSPDSVTVKTTAAKTVEVSFDAKTTFARNGQSIQESDLKIGDRVVIRAAKTGDKLVAHTVEIGHAGAAKTAKH